MTKEGKNRQTREIGLTYYSLSYKPDLPLPSMVAESVIGTPSLELYIESVPDLMIRPYSG